MVSIKEISPSFGALTFIQPYSSMSSWYHALPTTHLPPKPKEAGLSQMRSTTIRRTTSSQHSTSPIASLTEELQHQGSLPKPCSIQLWQSKGFVRHSKSETPYLYSEECSTMPMDMHFSRISTLTGIQQKMWYQTQRNLNVLAPAQIFLSASDSTQ